MCVGAHTRSKQGKPASYFSTPRLRWFGRVVPHLVDTRAVDRTGDAQRLPAIRMCVSQESVRRRDAMTIFDLLVCSGISAIFPHYPRL